MPPALPAVNPMNPLAGIYGSGTKVSDIEWKLARSYPSRRPQQRDAFNPGKRLHHGTVLPLGTPETTLFFLSSVPLYLWKLMAENCRLTFFS